MEVGRQRLLKGTAKQQASTALFLVAELGVAVDHQATSGHWNRGRDRRGIRRALGLRAKVGFGQPERENAEGLPTRRWFLCCCWSVAPWQFSQLKNAKVLSLILCILAFAQTIPEGVGQGYGGESKHVTSQLLALAEATPADKFARRPSPVCALPARCTCTSPSPILFLERRREAENAARDQARVREVGGCQGRDHLLAEALA